MKKNEIKHDPIRDFILEGISKIKERKQSFFAFILGVLVLASVMLNMYAKESTIDYSACILSDVSKDIVSINNYCNSDPVLNSISSNDNSLNSNTGIFLFINELEGMSLNQQIERFEESDLRQIQNKLVRSKFHEFFADILMDSNRLNDSKESYLKAIELSDSNFHLAILKIKLSKLLVLSNDLELASKYIKEVRRYDFEDIAIIKEIDILKGRLDQAKRRL